VQRLAGLLSCESSCEESEYIDLFEMDSVSSNGTETCSDYDWDDASDCDQSFISKIWAAKPTEKR
jgi:hypothetical protein